MPGKGTSRRYPHGRSIKNPAVYESLRREGMSKAKSAAISNGVLKKGCRKGRHHSGRSKG